MMVKSKLLGCSQPWGKKDLDRSEENLATDLIMEVRGGKTRAGKRTLPNIMEAFGTRVRKVNGTKAPAMENLGETT